MVPGYTQSSVCGDPRDISIRWFVPQLWSQQSSIRGKYKNSLVPHEEGRKYDRVTSRDVAFRTTYLFSPFRLSPSRSLIISPDKIILTLQCCVPVPLPHQGLVRLRGEPRQSNWIRRRRRPVGPHLRVRLREGTTQKPEKGRGRQRRKRCCKGTINSLAQSAALQREWITRRHKSRGNMNYS